MEKLPFNDLPEDRQLEILSGRMEHMDDYWHECIISDFTEELESFGFREPEINFSGFWSQGDGASFTSNRIDILQFIKTDPNIDFNLEEDKDELSKLISDTFDDLVETPSTIVEQLIGMEFYFASVCRINHRYYHSNSVNVGIGMENYFCADDDEEEVIDEYIFNIDTESKVLAFKEYLDTYLNEWVKTKCNEMYTRLEAEWEAYNKCELEDLKESNELYSSSSMAHSYY